jgi:pilus assembly protein CpaE
LYVVSDRDATALAISEVLNRVGYSCPLSHSMSPTVAREKLTTVEPDLVFFLVDRNSADTWLILESYTPEEQSAIVAVGDASDASLVLRAMRNGCLDFLNLAELDTEIQRVVQRYEEFRQVSVDNGTLINVFSGSGGSGVSTLTANLASRIALNLADDDKRPVGVVDFNLHSPSLHSLFDLDSSCSSIDLMRNLKSLDRTVLDAAFVTHGCGVQLLSAPEGMADCGLITPELQQMMIGKCLPWFSSLIVDLGSQLNSAQLELINATPSNVCVFSTDFSSVRCAKRLIGYLEQLGVDPGSINLVANRVGRSNELPSKKIKQIFSDRDLHTVPEDTKGILLANNRGIPFVLENRRKPFARSVDTLLAQLSANPTAE